MESVPVSHYVQSGISIAISKNQRAKKRRKAVGSISPLLQDLVGRLLRLPWPVAAPGFLP